MENVDYIAVSAKMDYIGNVESSMVSVEIDNTGHVSVSWNDHMESDKSSSVSIETDFIGSDELNVVPIEMDLSFI